MDHRFMLYETVTLMNHTTGIQIRQLSNHQAILSYIKYYLV